MAEREGFEPPVPRRAQQISSLPRSTTPASLRGPSEPRILSGARDPLLPVHVLAQGARHANSPVGVLAVLENRDQVRPTARPEPFRVCTGSGLPFSLRNRACMRRAWNASKLEHEEISRYAFCDGSQTSIS